MMDDRSKLVPFSRMRRQPDPARAAEFAATARRLQREREAAAEVITKTLATTPRAKWPALAQRSDFRNSGALEQLGREVDRNLGSAPLDALAVAELSVAIAETLTADSYPAVMLAQMRGHAWKDVGLALCHSSRYDEALEALDRAQAALAPIGILGHDEAIVAFVRAATLQHLRRFDEAQALLTSCADVFRMYADTVLYDKCAVSRGILLVRRGDYRAARELLRPLEGRTDDLSDASVRLALGWCGIHLADNVEALQQFTRAMNMFTALGCALPALRAAAGIGAALLRLGDLERAIHQLSATRERFLRRDMTEEAGLTGLEIVEAQLQRGDADVEDARALCARIVREFTVAGMNRRAIEALAYLNDAVSTRSASPEVVRSVHDYIVALRNDPTREFAAIN